MKHLRNFEKHRNSKKQTQEVSKTNESVLQVNDIYKVRILVDVPQSLINSYAKKVKDELGKNVRQFYGDMDVAEELVKNVVLNGLNIDNIQASALMGGEPQAQTQGQSQTQGQVQVQSEPQGQIQGQAQAQPQIQGQAQAQPQIQGQAQGQSQGQAQAQPQGQAQAQIQVQGQGQAQDEFEEIEEEDEEETGGEEELPL